MGQLAAIVSSSPEAMLSVDREGRVLSWNRGAEELFGWRAAEAIGQPYDIILPPGDGGASQGLRRALAGQNVREETVRLARDGTPIAALVTKAPVRDPDGAVQRKHDAARPEPDVPGGRRERRADDRGVRVDATKGVEVPLRGPDRGEAVLIRELRPLEQEHEDRDAHRDEGPPLAVHGPHGTHREAR